MDLQDLLNQDSDNAAGPDKPSPLKSLESDLKIYKESIREVAIEIIVEGISTYPLFIAHQHEVKIGELILDRNELNTAWSINASTLEEFVETGVIAPDRKDFFVKNYKNAHDFMCLFVIVPEGANFVFYPYGL